MPRRRIYFAFHYQDVIDFRANVVRKSGAVTDNDTFIDGSLWEEAKKKSPLALKRLINSGLENTSATCVLIGSETFLRPWVRYELFKSFERGNGLFGVHINSIQDKHRRIYRQGQNPFSSIGFHIDKTRLLSFVEFKNDRWYYFTDVAGYKVSNVSSEACDRVWTFSDLFATYDWALDDGHKNLHHWAEISLDKQAKYNFLRKF